jgi:hypothetical protein
VPSSCEIPSESRWRRWESLRQRSSPRTAQYDRTAGSWVRACAKRIPGYLRRQSHVHDRKNVVERDSECKLTTVCRKVLLPTLNSYDLLVCRGILSGAVYSIVRTALRRITSQRCAIMHSAQYLIESFLRSTSVDRSRQCGLPIAVVNSACSFAPSSRSLRRLGVFTAPLIEEDALCLHFFISPHATYVVASVGDLWMLIA